MRYFKVIIPALFLMIVLFVCGAFISKNNPVNSGFAVVELFTSEGCSSCPPADALVAKIQKESEGKPVYILAYHVDYWDRLGWKDAFSSAQYSDRQKQYARWIHSPDGIYTPQIVVNGKTQFVGSEENTLRSTIKNVLQQGGASGIALNNIHADGQKVSFQYVVQGAGTNATLQIALIQRTAQTKVARGENGGRTLSHVQIVRELQSIPLKHANGVAGLITPADFITHGAELIAFVQDSTTGTINSATKAEL
jgi:hypothetical protein